MLKESGGSYGDSLADAFAGYLSASIAHMIVNSLSFLVTFLWCPRSCGLRWQLLTAFSACRC
ncbi:hypothetical protein LC724_26500 [Blautia sp. RD014234]|nr:hypothetical protein [Blautia parvula]